MPLLQRAVRRVRNPEFVSRRSGDTGTATEWLFDRVDALLYAAGRWGGIQCQMNATIARVELDHLRDPRFILPGLSSPDHTVRLRTAACLAFCPSDAALQELGARALNDVDPAVREVALWAYCFADGPSWQDLVTSAARERDPAVRRAAMKLLEPAGSGADERPTAWRA